MEKIILVIYVDIRDVDNFEVKDYINSVVGALKNGEGDNITTFYVPIKSETRIECINPKLVSKEDYQQAKKALETNDKKVKSLIDHWFNGVRINLKY